jgi:hypothetical protein
MDVVVSLSLSLSLSPGEDRGLGREMEGCGLWLESG